MDWGGDDFETALEGAGYVGNKEIAIFFYFFRSKNQFICVNNVRKNRSCKILPRCFSTIFNCRGPHCFTFLHHAQKGGDDSKELLEYFQSKGLKDTKTQL